MSRPAVISLDADLPARARSLDAGTAAKVFGGCAGGGQPCTNNWDCCDTVNYIPGMGFFGLACGGNPRRCYDTKL
jgi:hypothetical protein